MLFNAFFNRPKNGKVFINKTLSFAFYFGMETDYDVFDS